MINDKRAPHLCVAVIFISVGCRMLSPENFMTASPLECKPLSLVVDSNQCFGNKAFPSVMKAQFCVFFQKTNNIKRILKTNRNSVANLPAM